MGSVDIPPFLREQQKAKVSSGDIPPFLKKKDEVSPSKDGVEVLPTVTESTSPSKSTSPLPFDVEGIFNFGKQRKKEGSIPANIPKAAEEVQQVLRKVNVGAVQAADLSALYKTDWGKPVVKQIIDQYAPSGLGFDEEVFRSGEKWEKLSKDIRTKNRTNAVVAEEANISEIDKYISSVTQQDKLVRLYEPNKFGEIPASSETKLPIVDPNNKLQLSQLYSSIEDSEYIVDADGNRDDNKKKVLLGAILEKQKYLTSKEGINPEIKKIESTLKMAVDRANRERQQGENIDADEMVKNDEVNAEHVQLGLSFLKDLKPATYENIIRGVNEKGKLSDGDFSMLGQIGQEISNKQKFIGAASNPALIDTETNLDYTTDEERKSEYARIIGERAKAAGIKTREFSEDQIFKLGYDLPNKVTLKQLADEEKILGYDAVPKTGGIEAIAQGVLQPFSGIESTIRQFGESPAETYLRSRRTDVGIGGQKVANEKGEISEILPSDRGNIWYDALRGFGQFIPQVLLTRGVGSVANKALGTTGAIAEGVTAYGGTAISTYFQTYGDAYADALQKTGDHATARLMGGINGVSAAAFELILPDVKIADKALDGLRGTFAKDMMDLLKKGGDPALLAKTGRGAVSKFVTGALDITRQEVTEEVGTQLVDYITESIFSPTTSKDRNLTQELWETAKATAVSMAIPALLGGGGQGLNKDFTQQTFNAAAINFNEYKNSLLTQLEDKNISQSEYNDAVKLLATHKQSIDQSPKININNNKLSGQQQLDYAYEDTKIKVYKEKAKNSDGVAKEMWESKVKESEDVQRKILMPKEGEKVAEPAAVVDDNARFQPPVQEVVLNEKEVAAIEVFKGKELTGALGIYNDVIKDENSTPAQKKEALQAISDQLLAKGTEATTGELLGKDADLIYDLEYTAPQESAALSALTGGAAENVVPSTLKDESGNPLVVYHGTKGDFNDFENYTIGKNYGQRFGNGFYFSEEKSDADFYAKESKGVGNERVISATLDMKNPLIVNSVPEYRQAVEREIKKRSINKVEADKLLSKDYNDILKDAGYDGVVYMFNGKKKEIVAFDKAQIKQQTSPTNETKAGAAVILPSEQRDIPTTTIAPKEQPKEQPVRKPAVILPKQGENTPTEVIPEQAEVVAQEAAKPTVVSRVVPSAEPAAKTGRTPVTLTGNTEQERQSLIKRRKADTFVPTVIQDEQKILDRVNRFNKEGLRYKRSSRGRSELNNIKVAIDQFNRTHNKKYSALQNRTGNIEYKNNDGSKVQRNNKATGDLSIDETGKPLMERSEKTKEVFNELLDRNIFPTGYTVDGRRMNESQLDGAIQDILDGIPSRAANNYLNALETMIEKDDFDFSQPDIPQQERISLDNILETEKEQQGDVMDEKAVEDFLNEQSNITPEQEQTISDNIETLIDEYTIVGDTGQVQATPEANEATGNTTAEQNTVNENEKAKAAETAEDKFDAKVDKAADAIIKFLTPKVKVDAQKQGLGVEEIVRAGAAAIKAAYRIEQNIEKAIASGIDEMRRLWNDAGYEDFPEDGLKDMMGKEFADLKSAPAAPKATKSENTTENEIISKVLSTNIDAKEFPAIFDNNRTEKQLTAITQGIGQDRVVDGDYIVALQDNLREVSIQSAHLLRNELGADWGVKTLKWIEDNPSNGNLAQVIGVLNIISTENFQDIQNTHDGNKLNKLKQIQNRIDVAANFRARTASLGLNQRRLYVNFAKGDDMRSILHNSILTPEMLDLQESFSAAVSEPVTDDEVNAATIIPPPPPKKQKTSLIRKVTGSAKRQSNPSLKDDLKTKASDVANKTKKSFKELIDEANAKIKNIKC